MWGLGDWNVYDNGTRLFQQIGLLSGTATLVSHGPLYYYLSGTWLGLLNWLGLFPLTGWVNPYQGLTAPNIVLLKLPMLAFDLAAGWWLSRIFDKVQHRRLALALWLFVPINFYLTYASGQDDMFMTATLAAALYYANRAIQQSGVEVARLFVSKNAMLTMLALGIGVNFKLFPLFLLPLAAIMLGKRGDHNLSQDWTRMAALIGVGLGPVALLFGPLTLFSKTFLSSVLFSWETDALSVLTIPTGAGNVTLFWLLYVGLVGWVLLRANRASEFSFREVVVYLSLVPLIFVAVVAHPAQFLIWTTPFLVVMLVSRPTLYPAYLIIALHWSLEIIFNFERNLDLSGILTNSLPDIGRWPTSKEFLLKNLPWPIISNLEVPVYLLALFSFPLLYAYTHRQEFKWPLASLTYVVGGPTTSTPLAELQRAAVGADTNSEQGPCWWWPLLPFGLFWLVLGGSFSLAVFQGGINRVEQPSGTQRFDYLTSQSVIEQPLLAPAGRLQQLELSFSTSNRYNFAPVIIKLYQTTPPGEGTALSRRLLRQAVVDPRDVKDRAFVVIKLRDLSELKEGLTPLLIELTSPEGRREDSLAPYVTTFKQVNNRAGQLLPARLNGAVSDQVLKFKLEYQPNWSEELRPFLDYFGKTKVFSFGYGLLCLGLALFGLVGGIRLRLRNRRGTTTSSKKFSK